MKLTDLEEANYYSPPQFEVGEVVRIEAQPSRKWTILRIRKAKIQGNEFTPDTGHQNWYKLSNNANVDEVIEEPEYELLPVDTPRF